MPARHQEFQAGEYYHIYHRGVNRQKIFFETENYLCLDFAGDSSPRPQLMPSLLPLMEQKKTKSWKDG
ncbi:MAG: hypothetical protein ACREOO_18790 [bacterium]